MDPRKSMIVIDGKVKTSAVAFCRKNERSGGYTVQFYNSPKHYIYPDAKVEFLTDPTVHDPAGCRLFHNGLPLYGVDYIAEFQSKGTRRRWYVEFADGKGSRTFGDGEIIMHRSCIADGGKAGAVFDYLKDIAAENPLETEDGTRLLRRQFEQAGFVNEHSAAASYLDPEGHPARHLEGKAQLIYPFGANSSQLKAVRAAFTDRISVIEGPPGTGKTQTILNIVVNILCQGKTVMVVSNNNSALENVVEKLEAGGLGFVTATLGNRQNRALFRSVQESEKKIPEDIGDWHCGATDDPQYLSRIQRRAEELKQVFDLQERLAGTRAELSGLRTERGHFEAETAVNPAIVLRRVPKTSARIMRWWTEIQREEECGPCRFLDRIFGTFKWRVFRLRMRRLFRGVPANLQRIDLQELVPVLQREYYRVRESELEVEIERLRGDLARFDADAMIGGLKEDSWTWLRNTLFHRFGGGKSRKLFTAFTPDFVKEYPIVLSTTFSSYSNFGPDVLFDYVVMDEASQVSCETGVLALMCGRNTVIVGDSRQLPNVITRGELPVLRSIADNHSIHKRYDCASLSFLESVRMVFPDAPRTLLREHYRCHPKIINFCNAKFYGGSLVVMTEDRGEENVVTAIRTVEGNHSRERMNAREVEVIAREVVPGLEKEYGDGGIGIISPYRNQVDALSERFGERIDAATVHKFQGREKDAIVLSMSDDVLSEFSDDANLLNVAVSRAKRRLCLVVSGNEQPQSRNVTDLIAYIRYNNFEVADSAVSSVFDMLYSQYSRARMDYLRGHRRISDYDSENLAYALISDVLRDNGDFSHLGVMCHFPLRRLLRDLSLIPDPEDRLYASRSGTHVDFLIYNRVSKMPVLTVEVDGYAYHRRGTAQSLRDERKNRILELYCIPLLRVATNQVLTPDTLADRLNEILGLRK